MSCWSAWVSSWLELFGSFGSPSWPSSSKSLPQTATDWESEKWQAGSRWSKSHLKIWHRWHTVGDLKTKHPHFWPHLFSDLRCFGVICRLSLRFFGPNWVTVFGSKQAPGSFASHLVIFWARSSYGSYITSIITSPDHGLKNITTRCNSQLIYNCNTAGSWNQPCLTRLTSLGHSVPSLQIRASFKINI